MTVNDLYQLAWEEHWNTARFKRSGWAKEVSRLWSKRLAPAFGTLQVQEVDAVMVRQFHRKMTYRPTTANRCLEVLSKVFTHAQENGIFDANPCEHVKAFREHSRKRYATPAELVKIDALLRESESYAYIESVFCRVLLLTGARPRSLQQIARADIKAIGEGIDGVGIVDFHGKSTSKTGEQETIVFTREAMVMMDKLPLRRDGLLFGPVKYRWYWDIIREKAGCKDLWLRDLRRTYATIALSSGIELGAVGELLNHRSTQTTKRYATLLPAARIKNATSIATSIVHLLRR
jgi:site-specific recombinase XerD